MESLQPLEVDVTPEPALYLVLRNLNYDLGAAYAEFIDNSIQSFLETKEQIKALTGINYPKLNITISVDSNKKEIVIEDNAGGIKRDSFQRAMRFGALGIHDASSLSMYGIGMKVAALWFTHTWSIKTSAIGETEQLVLDFDLNEIIKNNTKSIINADVSEAKATDHYTRITLKNHLWERSRGDYEDRIVPFVLEAFHKFQDEVDISFLYDAEKIIPNPKFLTLTAPNILTYPPVDKNGDIADNFLVEWKVDLDFEFKQKKVNGFIFIREVGSYGQPGIRLLRNNRVIEGFSIEPHIPSNFLGTKNKYAAQRIYGELNLNEFSIDFMKTKFSEDLKELFDYLHDLLKGSFNFNMINQANYYRARRSKDYNLLTTFEKENRYVLLTDDKNYIQPVFKNNATQVDNDVGEKPLPIEDIAVNPVNSDEKDTREHPLDKESDDEDTSLPLVKPQDRYVVEYSKELSDKLALLKNQKLIQLYKSLCTVSLKQHAVLCCVGAWSFFECLKAVIAKDNNNEFTGYFNSRVSNFSLERDTKSSLNRMLQDIAQWGNCNKHSGDYVSLDATQLREHFKVLTPFVTYLIDDFLEKNK